MELYLRPLRLDLRLDLKLVCLDSGLDFSLMQRLVTNKAMTWSPLCVLEQVHLSSHLNTRNKGRARTRMT